ncbi:MAG: bifunctional pyr operon transcriptional regulator/uracil phosphoribosyltransferase PyrR [Deltaproteobacteria bacterium]|nr:bifunctional pyr operon transcriptional regulator/uracil phosphoribosyltransferase PyrR [Deltaproteobacteria bacterium]
MAAVNRILTASDIERILMRMACEIVEKHKAIDNMALVGIHTRGVFLARRIAAIISKTASSEPLTGTLDISLYRDDWSRISTNPVVRSTQLSFDVDDREIILMDDVLYTGRTVRAAMDAIIDFGRPKRIELAVLIDRGHRELPIEANFSGKYVKTSESQAINVLMAECDGEDGVEIMETVVNGGTNG